MENKQPPKIIQKIESMPIKSLLEVMEDNREFESLLRYRRLNIDFVTELRKSLEEIRIIRKIPAICYLANVVNPRIKSSVSIDYDDDLPFAEMISTVPPEFEDIDVIIVTPGGIAQQTTKFVDKLRKRFKKVNFIIPNIAMSAGTILVTSGNEIYMGPNSYIGPIDPQVPGKDGYFIPLQSILTLIKNIQKDGEEKIKKGQNPDWTDMQIMRQLDHKEIGLALNLSDYSIELVENFLYKYKFENWTNHSKTGKVVTDEEKKDRAKVIATQLCTHEIWKTHSRGITREIAWDECQLKIKHFEEIEGFERAMRRFWALTYFMFDLTPATKVFISDYYSIFRNDINLTNKIK